ncbi:response regulator [Candidatus Pantoea deserta]|uniref:Response regulator n=1 Tax=Candidatus Pantoea deserta TaxID=1869313 RepID=A0A3N4NR96_9GAMM|nr:response regulator [Pantoea deserta]RPD94630.1 response regulator [Pantoea deserta]
MTLPRIVIVDDERAVRQGLSNLLQSDGYRTESFASGESLLENITCLDSVAMLIIDIRLKGMSGFDLFEALKKQGSPPPVLFISADAEESVSEQALFLGAITFMHKPLDIDGLLELIRRQLEGQGGE